MSLSGKKIGIAFTGSFCTYARIFEELEALQKEGPVIQTIFLTLHKVSTAVLERLKVS